jgi:hypothetical protein
MAAWEGSLRRKVGRLEPSLHTHVLYSTGWIRGISTLRLARRERDLKKITVVYVRRGSLEMSIYTQRINLYNNFSFPSRKIAIS